MIEKKFIPLDINLEEFPLDRINTSLNRAVNNYLNKFIGNEGVNSYGRELTMDFYYQSSEIGLLFGNEFFLKKAYTNIKKIIGKEEADNIIKQIRNIKCEYSGSNNSLIEFLKNYYRDLFLNKMSSEDKKNILLYFGMAPLRKRKNKENPKDIFLYGFRAEDVIIFLNERDMEYSKITNSVSVSKKYNYKKRYTEIEENFKMLKDKKCKLYQSGVQIVKVIKALEKTLEDISKEIIEKKHLNKILYFQYKKYNFVFDDMERISSMLIRESKPECSNLEEILDYKKDTENPLSKILKYFSQHKKKLYLEINKNIEKEIKRKGRIDLKKNPNPLRIKHIKVLDFTKKTKDWEDDYFPELTEASIKNKEQDFLNNKKYELFNLIKFREIKKYIESSNNEDSSNDEY